MVGAPLRTMTLRGQYLAPIDWFIPTQALDAHRDRDCFAFGLQSREAAGAFWSG
jgi:hypothetical protein